MFLLVKEIILNLFSLLPTRNVRDDFQVNRTCRQILRFWDLAQSQKKNYGSCYLPVFLHFISGFQQEVVVVIHKKFFTEFSKNEILEIPEEGRHSPERDRDVILQEDTEEAELHPRVNESDQRNTGTSVRRESKRVHHQEDRDNVMVLQGWDCSKYQAHRQLLQEGKLRNHRTARQCRRHPHQKRGRSERID